MNHNVRHKVSKSEKPPKMNKTMCGEETTVPQLLRAPERAGAPIAYDSMRGTHIHDIRVELS